MITLPGPVEIDECMISAKIKGQHGRRPNPGTIVFGIRCRSTGLVLLFPVPNRSKETLLPILIEHVEEGATVISDKYSSYVSRNNHSHIVDAGYQHYFINHTYHFVDPVQNYIHTNSIERTWRSFRSSISQIKRSLSQEKVVPFIDMFKFFSYFNNDSLYEVLLQMMVVVISR